MQNKEQTITPGHTIFSDWKPLFAILLLASLFRLWGTFDYPAYLPTSDEGIHIPNAISLGTYGTTTNFNWQHPLMGGMLLNASMALFGNTPVGWRAPNVCFGILSVLLLWLISRQLCKGCSRTPLIAASLLACDPFHIYMSRTTFTEIPVSFFFLLYFYFLLEYTENNRQLLPLAGIAMGLTIATKAYYAIAFPITIGYAIHSARQRREHIVHICIEFSVMLVLLPITTVMLSYYKWFGRGYTLREFIQMKQDATWLMKAFKNNEFVNLPYLLSSGAPWEWFLKPFSVGQQIFNDGTYGQYILEINNFPFRVLVLPALIYAISRAWRGRSFLIFLPTLLFMASYGLFFMVGRPMFSYSSLVLLPFAWFTLAYAIAQLSNEHHSTRKLVTPLFITAVVLWGIYTFPLVAGKTIIMALYSPLLTITALW